MTEDKGQKVGATIEHFRVFLKTLYRVDETLNFHNPDNLIQ
jgi:hypothetical protein